tara:strand:+ start:3522 stop:3776 length:255 start_codon:yes stop_codon:yes gene_type:complete
MKDKMKLTEEEVSELKELKQEFQQLTNVVGNLEIQIMDYQLKKEQMKVSLNSLQQKEFILAKKLNEKYGEGSISLETGEFLPNK